MQHQVCDQLWRDALNQLRSFFNFDACALLGLAVMCRAVELFLLQCCELTNNATQATLPKGDLSAPKLKVVYGIKDTKVCVCMQAYAKPPALVELTLSGVMTVLQKTPTWDEAKKQLGDANFMEKLLKFDKDKLNDALLKKLQKFTTNTEFTPEVGTASLPTANSALIKAAHI